MGDNVFPTEGTICESSFLELVNFLCQLDKDFRIVPLFLRALPLGKKAECVDKLKTTLLTFLNTLTFEEKAQVEELCCDGKTPTYLQKLYQSLTPEERASQEGLNLAARIVTLIFEKDEESSLEDLSKIMVTYDIPWNVLPEKLRDKIITEVRPSDITVLVGGEYFYRLKRQNPDFRFSLDYEELEGKNDNSSPSLVLRYKEVGQHELQDYYFVIISREGKVKSGQDITFVDKYKDPVSQEMDKVLRIMLD